MSNENGSRILKRRFLLVYPHISSYALTVEPKTAMSKMIQTGKMEAPKDVAQEHL
jgi:oxygen-independent coproporphyrinogen-3 oxidase